MNLGFGPNLSLSKNPVLINNEKNFSKEISPGLEFQLTKAKEKKYIFILQNDLGYSFNSTATSTGTKLKTEYYTNYAIAELTIYLKKVWQFVTRYENTYQGKTIESGNSLQTNILNARIQRTFKNDEFTLYISGNDLLNQNRGISRSFYGGNYSEVINDRLKRYFLLGFRWDFKNKSATAK